MTRFEDYIVSAIAEGFNALYGAVPEDKSIQVQRTRKDLAGDFTVVVFPLLKLSKKDPETTGKELGQELIQRVPEIDRFEVVKGFLNLILKPSYWLNYLNQHLSALPYGEIPVTESSPLVMIEFSSPNTNKPLHLGHIRNNLLGLSLSRILQANGYQAKMVNLVNDRGIHICKSMLAWQKWGNGETPDSAGMKGDQFVGKYYVAFDKALKKEIAERSENGMSDEEAAKNPPLLVEAQEMLREWEAGDEAVNELWSTMNAWVYDGFDQTYASLGISFDKIYYESETYKLGKSLVKEGLGDGVLFQNDDGSIWADLTQEGLDQKLLIRSDGTSVYMTQDLGTAHQRYEETGFSQHIYVVGNEQNYHFKVLKLILKKLGFDWADRLHHLSYGMVELPEGKMKSREGKVVDADDLIDEMVRTASDVSTALGKLEGFDTEEKNEINRRIALGALKYFILKVDPTKTMLFNPAESIDFNGNTGPFIQYTYVRILSVLRKAESENIQISSRINPDIRISDKEKDLLKTLYTYPDLLAEAGAMYSPALIANYLFELVKTFNHFYQHHQIINESDKDIRDFRLTVSSFAARHVKEAMYLLGIEMPERM